jgi:hypothetical protein
VSNLALKIGQVDRIGISDDQLPHTGGAEIKRHRTPQPAGANNQYSGFFEPLLTFNANLRQKNMPAVAEHFLIIHRIDASEVPGGILMLFVCAPLFRRFVLVAVHLLFIYAGKNFLRFDFGRIDGHVFTLHGFTETGQRALEFLHQAVVEMKALFDKRSFQAIQGVMHDVVPDDQYRIGNAQIRLDTIQSMQQFACARGLSRRQRMEGNFPGLV